MHNNNALPSALHWSRRRFLRVVSTSVAAVPLLSACRGTPTTPPPGPEAAHSSPSPRWPLTLNTAAGGQTVGYDNIAAASYGVPAGLQACGDALVCMTDVALQHLDRREGVEIGGGPSMVVVDDGVAKTLTTTTARADVSACFFGQEGLMAGLGLQGAKITRMAPSPRRAVERVPVRRSSGHGLHTFY